ncbi:hypothetical protein ASPZODRAFT_29471 [Penicilliopsis zonata CBS 506.65]|uniref:Uncharacterized protein n=1 Tax=Penicilliopsis zonata CBS 506.65 TaxID=1073090 RepID=A0A1L9S4I5_9EURO|nr:hypothetical protein ASPZODRAFT_29471 [Penicilliopsis zonata CBS 506.65]OJJ42067.1 hypothetical protein ASPZODRAFT_29471 [Penicilliopsis zonata CBS 506.65]
MPTSLLPRHIPSSSFHTLTANPVYMEMECPVPLSRPEPAVLPSRASSSGFQSSHQSPRSNTSHRPARRYRPDPHLSILPVSLPQSSESKTTVRSPGQQFVEYFTERRKDTECRSCIFICWTQGNLAKVVDIPFTSDELNDEKKVFQRLRENFFQRRGYMRTFFYSAYPEQAKIHPLGYPDMVQRCFFSTVRRFEAYEERSKTLGDLELLRNALPGDDYPCYPSDGSESRYFIHLNDCLAHVGETCGYEDIDHLEGHLLDVENIPPILEKTFMNPELAVGQNLLKRDIFSLENSSSYINTYKFLRPEGRYRGFAYLELNAIFIREEKRLFRLTLFIVITTALIVYTGNRAFHSWEAGVGLGALYTSLITLWVMLDE